MRRVRNQRIHSSNPSLLFARGVESIVSEQLQRQRQRNREQVPSSKPAVTRPEPRGNFLTLLMRQFANI
jgi:hypothetical protein